MVDPGRVRATLNGKAGSGKEPGKAGFGGFAGVGIFE
jgi:hypothetical protein